MVWHVGYHDDIEQNTLDGEQAKYTFTAHNSNDVNVISGRD